MDIWPILKIKCYGQGYIIYTYIILVMAPDLSLLLPGKIMCLSVDNFDDTSLSLYGTDGTMVLILDGNYEHFA